MHRLTKPAITGVQLFDAATEAVQLGAEILGNESLALDDLNHCGLDIDVAGAGEHQEMFNEWFGLKFGIEVPTHQLGSQGAFPMSDHHRLGKTPAPGIVNGAGGVAITKERDAESLSCGTAGDGEAGPHRQAR